MGIRIDLVPMLGLGFTVYFWQAVAELTLGPIRIFLGDLDALEQPNDE